MQLVIFDNASSKGNKSDFNELIKFAVEKGFKTKVLSDSDIEDFYFGKILENSTGDKVIENSELINFLDDELSN